jgi:type I restriction-modification system DNA methylase subunit
MTLSDQRTLYSHLATFIKPTDRKMHERGEIFTPINLVESMLDKLEFYDNDIFAHREYTWLDPTCGVGNFLICLYYRLMNGLQYEIPEEEERRKHILENMIYASELNPKYTDNFSKIMGGEKYKLNIYTGDFLTIDEKHPEWTNFNVILGNPPYNFGALKRGGAIWQS